MDKIDGDMFHAIAFAAMVTEAKKVQGWPDSEKVKQEAYRLYEAVKGESNG
jgi:hypothetical protein